MEKVPQAKKVKRDVPICDKCSDSRIVQREDGSYKCRRCGYDTGKKMP